MGGCCGVSIGTLSPAIVSFGTRLCIANTNTKPFLKQKSTKNDRQIQFKICCCSSSSSTSLTLTQTQPENKNRRRREAKHFDDGDTGDFVVVNFYKFVSIKHPQEEVAKHLAFVEGLNLRGRIYVNEQGINAQYSGPSRDALAYVEWLREDENFSDLLVQICPALNGHAFPKLKLRYKPSLLEGGISHLPLLDPSMRAIPLAPSEWRNKLEAGKDIDKASNSDLNRDFILLDLLQLRAYSGLALQFQPILVEMSIAAECSVSSLGYEWDIGHFHGARRPDVDCFRSTSFGLSQREAFASDPLADLDKEKTDILMYCTGGIRCDVYSTILRQRGFHNLYALKGGVSHYLENEGPVEWVGNLFVFDSRLSLPPSAYKPDAVSEARMIGKVSENPFATCYICSSQVRELRHRNCANLDCNLLFLCCADCVKNLRGCCCLNCTTAPQRRPVLPGSEVDNSLVFICFCRITTISSGEDLV
ncbi:Rhodanese-like domain-containing protein 8 [Citrus sinensis]|uniref:Rhodanese-like domain-containing protein 8 n=1 Tax=Citrus sinensis TaxID=2711 RepID=A0ACB8M5V2_CITSI|nr:Rhodanese-like domain-containing protein 8 [Citrus sinensis]